MDAVTWKVPQRMCGWLAGFGCGPGVLGALPSPARKKDSVVNTSVSESVKGRNIISLHLGTVVFVNWNSRAGRGSHASDAVFFRRCIFSRSILFYQLGSQWGRQSADFSPCWSLLSWTS